MGNDGLWGSLPIRSSKLMQQDRRKAFILNGPILQSTKRLPMSAEASELASKPMGILAVRRYSAPVRMEP